MSNILEAFLSFGLIDEIEGDDTRYEKIEIATQQLAEKLRDEPGLLIDAILSGVYPNVSVSMPIVQLAKECIQQEWKSVSSAYTDEPISLYRAMLLQACGSVLEEGNNASIMWLTVCDVLPELKLGKEEEVIKQLLNDIAFQAEKNTLVEKSVEINGGHLKFKFQLEEPTSEYIKVNRGHYWTSIGDAVAPEHLNLEGKRVSGPNPNKDSATNSSNYDLSPDWAGAYAERMSTFLADEIDAINKQVHLTFNGITESVNYVLYKQKESLQEYQSELAKVKNQERTKLDVLWWSEALYSESLKDSYRNYPPEISSIVMSYDLLDQIAIPSPASVGYTLSETVNKLTDDEFDKKYSFIELLSKIREERNNITSGFYEHIDTLPSDSSLLNIRDLVVIAFKDEQRDLKELINRSIIPQEYQCSLPALSRAVFRQEQAYRLAKGV